MRQKKCGLRTFLRSNRWFCFWSKSVEAWMRPNRNTDSSVSQPPSFKSADRRLPLLHPLTVNATLWWCQQFKIGFHEHHCHRLQPVVDSNMYLLISEAKEVTPASSSLVPSPTPPAALLQSRSFGWHVWLKGDACRRGLTLDTSARDTPAGPLPPHTAPAANKGQQTRVGLYCYIWIFFTNLHWLSLWAWNTYITYWQW